MTLEGIKSATKNIAGTALQTGHSVARAFGRVFEYIGTTLSGIAKKVADWVKPFINNIPIYYQTYSQILKDYVKLGINYIRENKGALALGSGISIGIGAIVYGFVKLIHKSEDSI